MSLTSELHEPDSPMLQFFAAHFPDRDGFWNAWSERVWMFPTIRPHGSLANYPWALVGAALDYRIRICWRPYAAADTVAAIGARYARRYEMPGAAEMWHDLASRWDVMMAYIKRGLPLDPDREDRIARMCIALAAYEAIARSGREASLLARTTKIDEVLSRVPAEVVDDIDNLLDEFKRSDDRFISPQSTVLNPMFSGAMMVGGADGDVILDQYLWDFKTTLHPTRASNDYWPYQILGYGLLDLDDQYQLEGAGIYLSRQGAWISWSWPEMLALLGARPNVSMREWRARLSRHMLANSLL